MCLPRPKSRQSFFPFPNSTHVHFQHETLHRDWVPVRKPRRQSTLAFVLKKVTQARDHGQALFSHRAHKHASTRTVIRTAILLLRPFTALAPLTPMGWGVYTSSMTHAPVYAYKHTVVLAAFRTCPSFSSSTPLSHGSTIRARGEFRSLQRIWGQPRGQRAAV